MVTSGHMPMSSCPTRHPLGWPSRQKWAETCGQTSPWTTSPTLQSAWPEVKPEFLSFVLILSPGSCFLSVPFSPAAVFQATSSNCHLLDFPLFPHFLSTYIHAPLLSFHMNCTEPHGKVWWVNGVICPIDPYKLSAKTGSVPRDGTCPPDILLLSLDHIFGFTFWRSILNQSSRLFADY